MVTENNEELEYLSLKTERDATEDFTPENIRKISGLRFYFLFIWFWYTITLSKTSVFRFYGNNYYGWASFVTINKYIISVNGH